MSKKNLFLGGILAGLLLFAYVYNGPLQSWQTNKGKSDNFLSALNFEQVNRIIIERNSEETVLEMVGDKWKVAGTRDFYVKDDIMNNIFSSLEEARADDLELVSENEEKKKDFEIGDNGINLKLQEGDNLIKEFKIGKMGNDFKSTYISDFEDNKTYVVNASLNAAFGRGDWYDKTIFSVDKESISEIRFQYPDREFRVEKQE